MSEYIAQHWLGLTIWGIIALVALWLLIRFWGKLAGFIRETGTELGKCSWPWDPQVPGLRKYKELIDSTMVVIASTILLAGYVTGMDFVLVKVIGFLTRYHV
jgi:preprotein translocase subunit SecE